MVTRNVYQWDTTMDNVSYAKEALSSVEAGVTIVRLEKLDLVISKDYKLIKLFDPLSLAAKDL